MRLVHSLTISARLGIFYLHSTYPSYNHAFKKFYKPHFTLNWVWVWEAAGRHGLVAAVHSVNPVSSLHRRPASSARVDGLATFLKH